MVLNFKKMKNIDKETEREKENWVHRALQRAAFGCLRKVSTKAPPAAWEASSLAALALSCLNWILADSASLVPSSGRTRWIGMSPRRRRKTRRSRSRVVADAPEPVTEAGRYSQWRWRNWILEDVSDSCIRAATNTNQWSYTVTKRSWLNIRPGCHTVNQTQIFRCAMMTPSTCSVRKLPMNSRGSAKSGILTVIIYAFSVYQYALPHLNKLILKISHLTPYVALVKVLQTHQWREITY